MSETTPRKALRYPARLSEPDAIAAEAPLELVVDGEPLAVLLRTPSGADDDRALAVGFLLSEGVIAEIEDLVRIEPCRDPKSAGNRLHLSLAPGVSVPQGARRVFASTAACGLCGKSSIAALSQPIPSRSPTAPLDPAAVLAMGPAVSAHQAAFARSGSVHAAALFDGSTLLKVAEDVGRHNAVDKVIGRWLLAGSALEGLSLWVSGRVSFELAQKALVAGLGALIAVGGPTSLAVDLATQHHLTLIGFCRGERFNVYAGALLPAP